MQTPHRRANLAQARVQTSVMATALLIRVLEKVCEKVNFQFCPQGATKMKHRSEVLGKFIQ